MPAQQVDPRRIKQNRSYKIGELAACCGVHKNTVRHWQSAGLKSLDDERPIMFHGTAIRAFLSSRKASRKRPCPAGSLYCFRCRAPQRPAPGPVEFVAINILSGNIRTSCATCGTTMHRRARKSALASILPGRTIQFAEGQPRLKGRSPPSLNCDSKRCATT
ncbi:MAG: hypothetical protein Q8R44_17135 [Novosphingobium sp.]|nr:hypothetical protein [Novosphingobium sp.]